MAFGFGCSGGGIRREEVGMGTFVDRTPNKPEEKGVYGCTPVYVLMAYILTSGWPAWEVGWGERVRVRQRPAAVGGA